jgi:hypothetical protein
MELTKTADVTATTQKFFDEINPVMKAKGYSRRASKQSAAGDWTYTKGARQITLSGWHGKDAHRWGEGMMLTSSATWTEGAKDYVDHEILVMPGRDKNDYGAGQPEPVKHPRGFMCTADEFTAYKENLEKLRKYLRMVD